MYKPTSDLQRDSSVRWILPADNIISLLVPGPDITQCEQQGHHRACVQWTSLSDHVVAYIEFNSSPSTKMTSKICITDHAGLSVDAGTAGGVF